MPNVVNNLLVQRKRISMTLDEVVERFTPEQRTASNTVGENEIVVISPHENEYHILVGKPGWKLGQEIGSWPRVGPFRDLEEAKKYIAELPFASDYDPNGWIIDQKERQWQSLSS
jgi:hypothetical protein